MFNFDIVYLFYSYIAVFLVLYLRNHCITQGHEDLHVCFHIKFV